MRYSLLLFHCSLTLSHTNTFLVVTEFDVAALASPRRRNAPVLATVATVAPHDDDESDTDDDEEAPTDEAVISAAHLLAQNALDADA